ncbi:MAG: trehalase family glycosidase [Anaerolineales bacterium]
MEHNLVSPSVNLLRNQIDFSEVPFSDRGSRLMLLLSKTEPCLYVRLAERLITIEHHIEAYLKRPPLIQHLCFIDESGNTLDYEITSYPYAIYFSTKIGDFGVTFADNQKIAVGLPPNKVCGIRFHVSPQFWKKTDQGGEFKSIRNLAYATNGEIHLNEIIPERGGYMVTLTINAGDDTAIILEIANELERQYEIAPFSTLCDASEKRWKDWFNRVPPVIEPYALTYSYAWWIMANNLVKPLGRIYYEAMMPSMVNYVGLWLWDSAMHALAFRHIDAELARNQIRVMLECQLPDGMLPDAVYDEGVIAEIEHPIKAEVTKPPILAWAALKLHETSPDLDFLREVYIPLVRWNAWWFSMNDDDVDGLAQYNHPYSSGLDDNPLWDYGMPVESPDLNTYLCVQMGSLAMIAEILGMEAEAAMWRRRSTAIVRRMIEDLWDEDKGVFQAMLNNEPVPVLTPFNLYPIWTGQLPDEIRSRIIGHLTSPEEFWGEFRLPSVAFNDPHFDPNTMWRGPVWVNINYFFIEALKQVGEHQLADELREKTLDLIKSQPGIFEYYNSENGIPPERAAESFGWTAAVFIDLAIAASHTDLPPDPDLPVSE